MKRVLGLPLVWLSLYVAVSLGVLAATGGLEPQIVPDTQSFLDAANLGTLVEAFAHHRSIGYPSFLRLVMTPEHGLSPVPAVQVGLYFLSLYLFWFAVERLSGSGWFALAATLPLPWAGVMTLVPFFLFCGLRWVAVGHLGVVSFGGTNLAGIAASFVDGRVVQELPEEHRLLARGLESGGGRCASSGTLGHVAKHSTE